MGGGDRELLNEFMLSRDDARSGDGTGPRRYDGRAADGRAGQGRSTLRPLRPPPYAEQTNSNDDKW